MDPEVAEEKRRQEAKEKEEREIEDMIMNKKVTLEDIDKLNYA